MGDSNGCGTDFYEEINGKIYHCSAFNCDENDPVNPFVTTTASNTCVPNYVYDNLVNEGQSWIVVSQQQDQNNSTSPAQVTFTSTTSKTVTVTDELSTACHKFFPSLTKPRGKDKLGAGGKPMRGPKPSYPITLTEAEARELEHLVRAHTTAQALALRARIILQAHAHPAQSNQHLAAALGTTDRTVRKWRGRWVKTHHLADAPRSGAPRRFSPSRARPGHRHRL